MSLLLFVIFSALIYFSLPLLKELFFMLTGAISFPFHFAYTLFVGSDAKKKEYIVALKGFLLAISFGVLVYLLVK